MEFKKFLFITVKSTRSGFKFRFLPNQVCARGEGVVIDPEKNVRVQDGKSLKDFKAGAIYSINNGPALRIINGKYSVSRWSCTSLEETKKRVTLDETSRSSKAYYTDVLKEYEDLLEFIKTSDAVKEEDKKTDDTPVTPTFYHELFTDYLKFKPTVKDDGFYMSESDWMILIRNIKRNINTLVTGPTGSGKTTAIKLACEKLGIPCSVYDMGSLFDPISSLLGVHRLEAGSSKFDYAKFAMDIQKPGVILLDEISRAPIQSNNILFPCLDDRRMLPVEIAGCKDIRSISIHPEVCFIATANIGVEYTGTNTMDRALQNRFFPIELDYLDKKTESQVLQKRCEISKDAADLVVRIATEIRNIYKKQELSISVSTRETLMVGNLIKDGWSVKDATSMVFLPLFEGTTDPREESTERGKIRKLLMTY